MTDFEDHHYLLPLREKFKILQKKENDELERMQTILDIADETVKDVVARGTSRASLFEDVAKAANVSRNVGVSDNHVHMSDGSSNILFSNHLSDPPEVAKTDVDNALRDAVGELRGISHDSAIVGVSSVQQRVAPLRSALSVALKERDAGNLRALAQHTTNPRTQLRLKNLKAASVLFDNLGQIQREQLEPIEKRMMEQSEFVLPFHHPFVILANHIRTELLAHKTGEDIEDEFNDIFEMINRDLLEARRNLDPSNRSDGSIPTAKECYIALQTEKEERGDLHDRCIVLLEEAKEIERQGREFLAPTTQRVREQAVAALDSVTRKSEALRKCAKSAREQLETSLAKREASCQEKIDTATAAVQQLEERARINRNKQEKAVRRMREEIKNLVKLQGEHKSIVEELGQRHQDRVIAEVTLEGVKVACAARSERLKHAERACDHSSGISLVVGKQLENAIAECQAHISRVTAQEFSRCSRMGQKTVLNCAQWYRSLGDLLAIRAQRLEQINKRSEAGGWQVQFLQKHELSAQDSAIDEIQALRNKIEKVYVPLSRSVLALDVDCPTLKYIDVNDPATKRMREVFLQAPDAGRERLLREGAKEAYKSVSVRRSRRTEVESTHKAEAFSRRHVFDETDRDSPLHEQLMAKMAKDKNVSSLMIGKEARESVRRKEEEDPRLNASVSVASSKGLPSIQSPRNQIPSTFASPILPHASASFNNSSTLPDINSNRPSSRRPMAAPVPQPPSQQQQQGAPEPPPRRR